MFNIGGKINESLCNDLFSVYDYEYNKWYTAKGIECFRHVCWIHGDKLYIHGGLNNQNKILGDGVIQSYSLIDIFKEYPDLTKKIKEFVEIFNYNVSPLSNRPTPPNPIVNNQLTNPKTIVSKKKSLKNPSNEIKVILPKNKGNSQN